MFTRNSIIATIIGSLSDGIVESTGGGSTNSQGVTDAPNMEAEAAKAKLLPFVGKGKQLAAAIEDAKASSDKAAQRELLSHAKALSGLVAEQTATLEGFTQELKDRKLSDGIVRARKSEAKTVFDAYSKPANAIEDSRAAMEQFTGTYHDFIKFCRTVRDGEEAAPRQGTNEKGAKSRLNDKEVSRLSELLQGASMAQIMEAAKACAVKSLSLKDGEIAAIRILSATYLQPLSQSKDVGIAKFATETGDRAMAIVAAHDKATAPAKDAGKNVEDVLHAPEPATDAGQERTGTNG